MRTSVMPQGKGLVFVWVTCWGCLLVFVVGEDLTLGGGGESNERDLSFVVLHFFSL